MDIQTMRQLIKNGSAFFGIIDKAGCNISAQLSWFEECLLNNPGSIFKQFVIVL